MLEGDRETEKPAEVPGSPEDPFYRLVWTRELSQLPGRLVRLQCRQVAAWRWVTRQPGAHWQLSQAGAGAATLSLAPAGCTWPWTRNNTFYLTGLRPEDVRKGPSGLLLAAGPELDRDSCFSVLLRSRNKVLTCC